MRPVVVVTNPVHSSVIDRLSAAANVRVNEQMEPCGATALHRWLHDATAMMGFMTDRVDADLLRQAPALRMIACALKGYDNYDVQACTQAGVWLSIVPDLLTEPTAELALGLAIGLARHIRAGDALLRSGSFNGWRARLYGDGLRGATVAVVGMGSVGRAIVARLQGFGCGNVLGVDTQHTDWPGVESTTLSNALSTADYVFLAVPLTPATIHLIDADVLQGCKPGQRIVNVGRGSVVDELAVAHALRAGRLGGYAADVFACEDWAVPDHPARVPDILLSAPNTLFTPHLGSAVHKVRLAIEHCAADNILAFLRGEQPPDAINRPQSLPAQSRAALIPQ